MRGVKTRLLHSEATLLTTRSTLINANIPNAKKWGTLKPRLDISMGISRLTIKQNPPIGPLPVTRAVSFTSHNQTIYMGPHRMELISRLSTSNGPIVQSLVIMAKAAFTPIWAHYKIRPLSVSLRISMSDWLRACPRTRNRSNSKPVSEKFASQFFFSGYTRASPPFDSSHRSKVALHFWHVHINSPYS